MKTNEPGNTYGPWLFFVKTGLWTAVFATLGLLVTAMGTDAQNAIRYITQPYQSIFGSVGSVVVVAALLALLVNCASLMLVGVFANVGRLIQPRPTKAEVKADERDLDVDGAMPSAA